MGKEESGESGLAGVGGERMPNDEVCSRCGGTGEQEYLYFALPHWRKEECKECRGRGRIEMPTFAEKKILFRRF